MKTITAENEKILAVNENTKETELSENDLDQVSGGFFAYSTDFINHNVGAAAVVTPFYAASVSWNNWTRISTSGILF